MEILFALIVMGIVGAILVGALALVGVILKTVFAVVLLPLKLLFLPILLVLIVVKIAVILTVVAAFAAVIVPLVILTFYRAFRGDFSRHRRIARITLPLWLYVSITGVIVYLMLYQIYPHG